jgi:hypothetical protein
MPLGATTSAYPVLNIAAAWRTGASTGLSSETWQEREWSQLWSLLAECVPCILVRFKGEEFILFSSPDQQQGVKNKTGLSMFMQCLLAATVSAERKVAQEACTPGKKRLAGPGRPRLADKFSSLTKVLSDFAKTHKWSAHNRRREDVSRTGGGSSQDGFSLRDAFYTSTMRG